MTFGEEALPLERLVRLSADASVIARSIVAGNNDARPLEELVQLAADASVQARIIAAANSATPVELLLRLATDESPDVVEVTASHPRATAAVLERVVSDQLERRKFRFSQGRHDFPLGPMEVVAANPRTSQETLRTLANSVEGAFKSVLGPYHKERAFGSHHERVVVREVRVWAGIAGNPSAPDDLLDRVAREVHTLVSTEKNPNHRGDLDGLRETTLSKIVANPSTSVETLQFLSSGDWVARRTTTKSERDDGRTVTWLVWDHPATDAATQDMASLVRQEMSRRQWGGSSNSTSRLELASNPDTAPEILDDLSTDWDLAVRCEVASNPSTDPQAFQRLAADPAIEVRLAAAEATHPDLASAKYGRDRFSTASRESLYRSAFDQLAGDHAAAVRAAVAENRFVFWEALSREARDRYAFDDDPSVRASLLYAIADAGPSTHHRGRLPTANLSADALVRLIDTSGAVVWRSIAAIFDSAGGTVLNRLADTGDTETVVRVVKSLFRDPPLVIRLAASADPAVVAVVAAEQFFHGVEEPVAEALELALLTNPLTPGSYLLQFASDHAWRIAGGRKQHSEEYDRNNEEYERAIEAIEERLRSPESFSEYLTSRSEQREAAKERATQLERFVKLAIAHPNFPEAALIDYASGTDEHLASEAVRSGNIRVLVAAASNPEAKDEILNALAARPESEVRQALLENKSTPPELLVRLIQTGTT